MKFATVQRCFVFTAVQAGPAVTHKYVEAKEEEIAFFKFRNSRSDSHSGVSDLSRFLRYDTVCRWLFLDLSRECNIFGFTGSFQMSGNTQCHSKIPSIKELFLLRGNKF